MELQEKQFIGCCIPLIHSGLSEDLFFIQILDGITRVCEKSGYSPVLSTPSENFRDRIAAIASGLSGLILINPLTDQAVIEDLQASDTPFVVIGTPETRTAVFSVDIDVVGASFQVSHFLLSKGHRHIFYINSPGGYVHSDQNKHGFSLAHQENRIPWIEKNYTEEPVTSAAGYAAAEKVLQTFPECTAIVTTNEIVAKGVVDQLIEHNIRIPKKMAVISMGGTPVGALCRPGITTIDYSPVNLGTVAAELLIEVIAKKRIRPSHLLLPTQLIERETT